MSDVTHAARLPAILSYAERAVDTDTDFDLAGQKVIGRLKAWGRGSSRSLRGIVPAAARYRDAFAALSDDDLKMQVQELRPRLRALLADGAISAKDAGPVFAAVREASARVLGMPHYDVQLIGGFALLRGLIAEMRTGEGKTLCATLASITAALAGVPVHVITVNDYLAKRDAETMAPLYRFFGLTAGTLQVGQEQADRQAAYACDITHGSNKEFAFDYLRDRMELGSDQGNLRHKLRRLVDDQAARGLRMRGLHFAIIDEADSVLIDEARTPLILSGTVAEAYGTGLALFSRAMEVALDLREGEDYRVDYTERRLELTTAGEDRLDTLSQDDDGSFAVPVIRDHAIRQALSAQHLFHRDEDYILRDGKVQIVDENTGRVMEDRSWSEGLHQMVELKEGVELTEPRETLARITYQRFFRRYRRLSGMTGTATDSTSELWSVYRLSVARIPSNKPDIRTFAAPRIHRNETAKWQAIGQRVRSLHKLGRPVLLGTRSVGASQAASAVLTDLGIPHQVLNADQTEQEASIIAKAGQRDAVTVATNMAGRGTDIKLDAGISDLGGLHVILSEWHDSRRVDRQLEGRCGRQGDPGQVETHLSLGDALLRTKGAAQERRLAALTRHIAPPIGRLMFRIRQRRIERLHARMREDLLRSDRNLGKVLAVSGAPE